jgi:hypothetical protein
MRVVINQALIDRYRRISHILFFVSLAGMGVGFFYTWTSNPNSQGNQLSCLILPILLLMTLTSVRMANTWIREPHPVEVLSDSLKGLGKKYAIFHHVLPAPHVLIAPEGVFTITTVWQERPYSVTGKKWHGEEGLLRKINGYMRQDLLGNPFQTAQLEAQQMQKLVDKIAPDSGVEVQPLIVFISPKGEFAADDPLFPVLYADSKRKPSLRTYLRDVKSENRPTLTEEQIDKIDQFYGLVTRDEISDMLGYAPDETDLDDEAGAGEEDTGSTGEETSVGTILIAQSGQLYYIGATTQSIDEALDALRANAPQSEVELVHSFQTSSPSSTEATLRRKYANKRQKDNWFGLSKKDVSWLKARQDQ